MIKLVKCEHFYIVQYSNGIEIGALEKSVDGLFYFWPERTNGAWPSAVLKDIATALDSLNAEWEAILQQDNNKKEHND